jgi:ABC-type branched-subunit amino acid transport system substrate-binding protein
VFTLAYVGDYTDGVMNLTTQDIAIIQTAIDDYNQMLKDTGQNVSFVLKTADGKMTSDGALAAIQSLHETLGANAINVDFTVHVAGVKAYGDQNRVLVVSGTSTGINMAVPNDCVFRTGVNDTMHVKAIAAGIAAVGIKSELVVVPNDSHYGVFGQLLVKALTALGVTADIIQVAPNETDYASDVSAAGQKAGSMGAQSIFMQSDNDAMMVNFTTHAMSDPVLSKLQWWADDSATHTALWPPTSPATVSQFMYKRGWLGCTIPNPTGPVTDHLLKAYAAKMSGAAPANFQLPVYDSAWLMMEAMLACSNNGNTMIATFPEIASRNYGVMGNTQLDENGDLIASSVDIIKINAGVTGVEPIGSYNGQTGAVTWIKPPPSYDPKTNTVINL